ncbi:MAG: AsmA-like C-terminal domain-containing protein, partial [Rickettsiales bacterium]|nr:AsmA-like C-terminal domain-containing protein [Rickettsiales bacterium]
PAVNGNVSIMNMGETPELAGQVEARGPVTDIIIANAALAETETEMMATRLSEISGQANSQFSIEMPLSQVVRGDQVRFALDSELQNVAAPELVGDYSISEGNFKLHYRKQDITMQGQARVNNVPVTIAYKRTPDAHAVEEGQYTFTSTLTPSELEKLGVDLPEVVYGNMDVTLEMWQGLKDVRFEGNIAAKEIQLSIPALGWIEPRTMPFRASFSATPGQNKQLRVNRFTIDAGDGFLKANGSLELDNVASPESWKVTLESLRYGDNDLSFRIQHSSGGVLRADIRGKQWDVRPLITAYWANVLPETKEQYIRVNADINHVLAAGDVVLDDFLLVTRDVTGCPEATLGARIRGEIGKGFSYRARQSEEGCMIRVQTEDAGHMLRAMDFPGYIRNGALELSARYEDQKDSRYAIYDGKVHAKDFTLQKAPVLAKLLSLGSLVGVLDLLNGQGITFNKLKGEFSYVEDLLSLKGVKASGNALGFTLEGNVQPKQATMDLKGALVPAYALNTILGNVPLLGKLLVGKEGEGVLATNYSLSGSYPEPEITVNPLSLLTPGFLRNVWDLPEAGDKK